MVGAATLAFLVPFLLVLWRGRGGNAEAASRLVKSGRAGGGHEDEDEAFEDDVSLSG